jgi:3-oxoadipate enol-lactonase
MTQSWVEVPGGRLNVIDEGSGPPIVLLHAGIADLRAWDVLVPHLTGAGYRVIRYDTRGYGESTTEDVAFSNRADVVAVLDALGIARAVLVGNSRGGTIAYDTAIEFPERVAAVVGVAGGLGGFDGGATPEEMELFEESDRLESADAPDPEAIADLDVRLWVDGPLQPAGRAPEWIREAVRAMDAPLYRADRVMGQPIPLEPPAVDQLDRLAVPVLAVAGTLDPSESVVTARYLEANAPNAKAVVWDDVAHMIGMEVPERLSATIVAFVAPLKPWG